MHAFLALIFAFLLVAPGFAQSGEDRGAPMGQFDFYVLALSWSPSWCENTGRQRDSRQCDLGRSPGFVLHGLWPQYERGFPTSCGPQGRNPSRDAMDRAMRVFPDAGLARHQWQKHGTCSGLSPSAYFDAAAAVVAKIRIPEELKAPRAPSRWGVTEVERAFVQANPGLRNDMMGITCRRGQLEEVRICFSRDMRGFQSCQEVSRNACRTREISVPAAR